MSKPLLSRRNFIAASGVSILSLSPLQAFALAGGVEAVSEGAVLHMKADGRPVFDYRLRGELPDPKIKPAFLRAGYMHPVYTPAGRIVTDDYPDDHYHQHGIFFAWTKTEFEGRHPDFWNMGDGTGTVELEKLETSRSGADNGGFSARLRHV